MVGGQEQGRLVAPLPVEDIVDAATSVGLAARTIGTAGGERLVIEGAFELPLADAASAWRDAIPASLAGGSH